MRLKLCVYATLQGFVLRCDRKVVSLTEAGIAKLDPYKKQGKKAKK